jgi:hypothetical protein
MKIVMVINKELPIGLIANTAAVLGISAGKMYEEIVGADIKDNDGNVHKGVTTKPIPILEGTKVQVKCIREKLFDESFASVTVVDFSEIAQRSLDYENYTKVLNNSASTEIEYLGVCIYGPVKKINKLTGYLGLLK